MIDIHVHFRGTQESLLNAADLLTEAGLEAINLLTLITEESCTRSWLQIPAALLFKLQHPGCYAFAALDYAAGAPPFDQQAKRMRAMGFDGMKLYHGKPTMRRHLGFPLDDERYDAFYRYVCDAGFPVLHHVGDSPELWDAEACPVWARERGWCYADRSFLRREHLYNEAEGVLREFPDAPIIHPHFLFVAHDFEEAERLLSRYPGLHLDLTPGWEIYRQFSGRVAEWRDLFARYTDRIMLGTDNYAGRTYPNPDRLAASVEKISQIRSFLDGSPNPAREARNIATLGLPPEVVDGICRDNAMRLLGPRPREVNEERATAYLDSLIARLRGEDDADGVADGLVLRAAFSERRGG